MVRQVDPALMERLRDDRGNRVVFVSHCLLNENVRYLGGAFHSGAVPGTAGLLASGIGICQLPCPEQRAWGWVHKPAMMLSCGLRDSPRYRFRRPVFRLFLRYTRVRYWLLARQVAREIDQCQRAGVQITAVVGVGASPSCGVNTTLDTARAFERLAGCPLANIDRGMVNGCVSESCVAGEGVFIAALRARLRRHGITPPFLEHDLIAGMQGRDQTLALDQTMREATPGREWCLTGTRGRSSGAADMTVLVTAASEHCVTGEIAEAIARTLRQHGLEVVVLAPQDVSGIDRYDAVVLGSAVYAGDWLKPVRELVERCGSELARRPVWLFSSGPVGDPSRRLVQKMGEDPIELAEIQTATGARDHHIFAGKLQKQDLTRPQRAALALFRGLQGDFGDRAVGGGHRRESCGRYPELIREEVRVACQTAAA